MMKARTIENTLALVGAVIVLVGVSFAAGTALAQTAAQGKLRAGFFYIPHGAIMWNTPHGAEMDHWTPSGAGPPGMPGGRLSDRIGTWKTPGTFVPMSNHSDTIAPAIAVCFETLMWSWP